jgi:hypothetical protein
MSGDALAVVVTKPENFGNIIEAKVFLAHASAVHPIYNQPYLTHNLAYSPLHPQTFNITLSQRNEEISYFDRTSSTDLYNCRVLCVLFVGFTFTLSIEEVHTW